MTSKNSRQHYNPIMQRTTSSFSQAEEDAIEAAVNRALNKVFGNPKEDPGSATSEIALEVIQPAIQVTAQSNTSSSLQGKSSASTQPNKKPAIYTITQSIGQPSTSLVTSPVTSSATQETPQVAAPPTCTYETRLATFNDSWPIMSHEIPPPAILAAAGFCQQSTSSRYHMAACNECNLCVSNWYSKNPLGIHGHESPSCPFILKENAAIQAAAFEETLRLAISTKLPPFTSEYEDRLVTYRSSWPADCPTSEVMANAGFHSIKHKLDTFACEHCQVVCKAKKGINPLLLHRAYDPKCFFFTRKTAEMEDATKNQQLAMNVANQTAAFEDEELLKMAISTPLPTVFECRRCFAEFSSNSQLHQHIREFHIKKTKRSAAKSPIPHKLGASQLVCPEITPKPPAIRTPTSGFKSTVHSTAKSSTPRKFGASQLTRPETNHAVHACGSISNSVSKSLAPHKSALLTLTSTGNTSEVTAAARTRSTSFTITASASKSQPPPKCSASPLQSSETTSSPPQSPPRRPLSASRVASRPTTPPPTYRAISPSPPVYTKLSSYLTVQDLYERYAPPKSTHSAQKPASKSASYLTIQDLYEKFSKKPRSSITKLAYESSANRIRVFDSKQASRSASFVSRANKSMRKNVGKTGYQTMKSPATSIAGRIGFSAVKPACDLKSSSIDSELVPQKHAKTRFFASTKSHAQASITQPLCYIKSSKHAPTVRTSSSSVRSYVTSSMDHGVAVDNPRRFRGYGIPRRKPLNCIRC